MILFVVIVLIMVVLGGAYNGQKKAKLEKIEEIAEMKLAYGWKPEKACVFLDYIGLKTQNYMPVKELEGEWRCVSQLKIPFSKGEAKLAYSVLGVKDKGVESTLILSYEDRKHTVKNTAEQDAELEQFKEIFTGVANDLIIMSTGNILSKQEVENLSKIKLGEKQTFQNELFNITLHHYEYSKGAMAYNIKIRGKSAIPDDMEEPIQKSENNPLLKQTKD